MINFVSKEYHQKQCIKYLNNNYNTNFKSFKELLLLIDFKYEFNYGQNFYLILKIKKDEFNDYIKVARIEFSEDEEDSIYLDSVDTYEEFQFCGFMNILMNKFFDWIYKKYDYISYFYLTPVNTNMSKEILIKFYEKFGFKIDEFGDVDNMYK
jgi:GNAT superfamily N-acetyltransferase